VSTLLMRADGPEKYSPQKVEAGEHCGPQNMQKEDAAEPASTSNINRRRKIQYKRPSSCTTKLGWRGGRGRGPTETEATAGTTKIHRPSGPEQGVRPNLTRQGGKPLGPTCEASQQEP
jgi:hypothetical protein